MGATLALGHVAADGDELQALPHGDAAREGVARELAAAGAGEDELADLVGVVEGELLGHLAAHRVSQHVGFTDAEASVSSARSWANMGML